MTEVTILGLVQGLTEFLPVSSSGHLIVARLLFRIPDVAGTATDAFLHLGTLLAVLVYYWRVWWGIVRGFFVRDAEGNDKRQLLGKLLVATIPAALTGYFLKDYADQVFRGPTVVAGGFLVTAAAFFIAEALQRRQLALKRAGWREAFIVGLFQIISLVPGISRSGITIASGQAQGLSRAQAAHFSFLMSVPIIAGAGVGTLPALLEAQAHSFNTLLVGFFVSLIAGVLAIHALLHLARRISFKPFAIYLLAMAVIVFWFY